MIMKFLNKKHLKNRPKSAKNSMNKHNFFQERNQEQLTLKIKYKIQLKNLKIFLKNDFRLIKEHHLHAPAIKFKKLFIQIMFQHTKILIYKETLNFYNR